MEFLSISHNLPKQSSHAILASAQGTMLGYLTLPSPHPAVRYLPQLRTMVWQR